jgi:hypothetical protein
MLNPLVLMIEASAMSLSAAIDKLDAVSAGA